MRPLDSSRTYPDNRSTVFIEDLASWQIVLLMTDRDAKVEQIIGGRISPESRQTRYRLDKPPSQNQKHIYLRR
jgi:hypothetical protein